MVDVQEFGWAEEDLPKRKADRGSSLKADMAAELAKEPMFCFEARYPNPLNIRTRLGAPISMCATVVCKAGTYLEPAFQRRGCWTHVCSTVMHPWCLCRRR
jgi:hypothetical protein